MVIDKKSYPLLSLRAARITQGWWEKLLKRNPLLSLRSGGTRMDAIMKIIWRIILTSSRRFFMKIIFGTTQK